MSKLRILIAAMLLVWSPLSGAVAAALGTSLSHHHCDDAWHGHDHSDAHGSDIVMAYEECASRDISTDAWACDDCQPVFAAIAPLQTTLAHPPLTPFHLAESSAAQNIVVFSLFRPPKA